MRLEITMKTFLGDHTINETPTRWGDTTAGTSGLELGKWLPNDLRSYFVTFQPTSGNRGASEELRST
jgi:hypothetical protein